MNKTICPICGSKVKAAGRTVFCQCGWHKSFNHANGLRIQKGITTNLIIAGFVLMGSVVHLSEWGSSSLSIVSLKARQWTGLLSKQAYADLKNICMNLKKYDCVESAHQSYFRSSNDLSALHALGELQYRRGLLDEAKQTYTLYFTKKGKEVKAAYNYAQILEKSGNTQQALGYYKYALKASPEVAQVSVMRAYINLLIKNGQHAKAKAELSKFQSMVKKSTSLVQNKFQNWKKQARS